MTDRQGQADHNSDRHPEQVTPVVVAALVLLVVGGAWPASGDPATVALALGLGVVGAVAVGPVLAYEVQRWIGWRVVVPLLVGHVVSPRGVRRAPVRCAACGETAAPRQLATRAQSWLWRGGRCRGDVDGRPARRCRVVVPVWVAVIEVATGAGFALAAWRLGWTWRLVPALALVAGLVAITAVDVVHQRIPTRFVAATGIVCAAAGIPAALAGDATGALGAAAVGAAGYGGFLTFLYLVSPNGLGGGDVRLAWLVGAVVGALTWQAGQGAGAALPHVLTTAVVAAAIGLVTHLAVALVGRRSRTLPFAPSMTTAALLVGLLAQPA